MSQQNHNYTREDSEANCNDQIHAHDHAHSHDQMQDDRRTHSHDQMQDEDHTHTHDHTHVHNHTHTHSHTKAVINRLSRAIGHLEAVKKMVEDGRDCTEVLVQLVAVRSALNNTGKVILQDHIEHCIVDAIDSGDNEAIEELNKAIAQFVK